nr:HEAT repeat domain-containing protein [uncultured Holophaga sp.]
MISFQDFATAFQATLKALQMYTGSHPRSRSALENLAASLDEWLEDRPSVHIAASAQKLFVDGSPMEGRNLHIVALHRQFADREISGIVIRKGVPTGELQALLEVLILKPARIEEQGGVLSVLGRLDLRFISLSQTQYKAVHAGEGEAENEDEAPPSSTLSDPALWREALAAALAAGPPADLVPLAPIALSLGWGDQLPDRQSLEALRTSLAGLSPEDQAAVVAGLPSAPLSPQGLRLALKEVLGELPGMQEGTLSGLLQLMEWDRLSMEARIQRVIEGNLFWELNLDRRLAFLRELLNSGHKELLIRFLDILLEALPLEDPVRREAAAQTLAGVSHWMQNPAFPETEEGPLLEGISAHFGWEPLMHVHRSSIEALEAIGLTLLAKGDLEAALRLMLDLESLCALQEADEDWRQAGLARLREALGSPAAVSLALSAPVFWNPEAMEPMALPFFREMGEPAMDRLIEALGEEPDRRRRAHLMTVIRALHPLPLPALHRSLSAPTWYLVRNTLNLLAELGDASMLPEIQPCLSHPDRRVRQAAVRATWKLAGSKAAPILQERLPESDPETRIEILFGLIQIQATSALPVILDMALDPRIALGFRIKAVEALAQIPQEGTSGRLLPLVQRKGRIFSTAEPLELRVAAARAIRALGPPATLEQLTRVIAAESRGPQRDALQAVLEP